MENVYTDRQRQVIADIQGEYGYPDCCIIAWMERMDFRMVYGRPMPNRPVIHCFVPCDECLASGLSVDELWQRIEDARGFGCTEADEGLPCDDCLPSSPS